MLGSVVHAELAQFGAGEKLLPGFKSELLLPDPKDLVWSLRDDVLCCPL